MKISAFFLKSKPTHMLGLPLSLFVFVRFLMTPLLPSSTYVLFEWPLIYFQWKEAIKVQIGWNFTWAVGSLKFCTLVGSFCKSYKVSTKKIQKTYHSWHWRMMQNLKKNWLAVSNATWGIWWIFTQPLKSPKMFLWCVISVENIWGLS